MRSDLHLCAAWDPFTASAICAQESAALVLSGCGNEYVDIQGHVVDTGPECCEFAAARDEDAAVELKQQCTVGGQPVGRLIDETAVKPQTISSREHGVRWFDPQVWVISRGSLGHIGQVRDDQIERRRYRRQKIALVDEDPLG